MDNGINNIIQLSMCRGSALTSLHSKYGNKQGTKNYRINEGLVEMIKGMGQVDKTKRYTITVRYLTEVTSVVKINNPYSIEALKHFSQHFDLRNETRMYAYFIYKGNVGQAEDKFYEVMKDWERVRLREEFEAVEDVDGYWGVRYPRSQLMFICSNCSEEEARVIAKLLNENKAELLKHNGGE